MRKRQIDELVKIAKKKQISSLYAGIEKDNIVSIKSLNKVGFIETGKDKDGLLEF